MISIIVAQVLALSTSACVEGTRVRCSLPGCSNGWRECVYPGFGPCECADPPPPPPPQPWYAVLNDGLTKVRPGSSISSPVHQVTLDMASNEFEAFQLIVRPPTGVALENFRLTLNDLGVGASSLKANGGRITIYREEVINLGTRSGPDGDIGAWPDALIPAFDEVYNQRRNAFDVVAADGSSIPITIPGTAGWA